MDFYCDSDMDLGTSTNSSESDDLKRKMAGFVLCKTHKLISINEIVTIGRCFKTKAEKKRISKNFKGQIQKGNCHGCPMELSRTNANSYKGSG
ncbi:hypothetical protein LIER_08290 [Lithospermum erythrorhizon]|uniref:Uncharacterized protein n=1 Tax=Lithospermum erythrorhizon TaxID=34254 RepID=A0AAV3PBG9_LITER